MTFYLIHGADDRDVTRTALCCSPEKVTVIHSSCLMKAVSEQHVGLKLWLAESFKQLFEAIQ